MNQLVVIGIVIGIVLLLVVGSSFKPLKMVGSIVVKFIVAAVCLVVINMVGARFGFHLPINIATTSISALLGIPGIVALSVIQLYVIK